MIETKRMAMMIKETVIPFFIGDSDKWCYGPHFLKASQKRVRDVNGLNPVIYDEKGSISSER